MEQQTSLIPHQEMETTFLRILKSCGFSEEKALTLAHIFTLNSLEGVYSHGVNRFPRFVEYVEKGFVKIQEQAVCTNSGAAIEQWDGRLAAGPLNALQCTDRAMELARQHGMGCVALANTNHWMRGGTYGWRAAREGFVFIGWTNTTANMPAWGALDNKLGNNPLVLAVPYQQEAIVLDMAMSQYSYGSMEARELKEEPLPVPGGWDEKGEMTKDAAAILASKRVLPAGYWKGAGLSLLLDILASILSGGASTAEVSKNSAEYGVSQVYIAIDTRRLSNYTAIQQTVQNIIADYHASQPISANKSIRYPGERVLHDRSHNMQEGIPVDTKIWNEIMLL